MDLQQLLDYSLSHLILFFLLFLKLEKTIKTNKWPWQEYSSCKLSLEASLNITYNSYFIIPYSSFDRILIIKDLELSILSSLKGILLN